MSEWCRRTLDRERLLRAGVALGVVLLLAPAFSVGVARAATGLPSGPHSLGPAPASACAGASAAAAFTGSLSVDGGGSSPPSVSDVGVALTYWVTLNYTPTNGASVFYCDEETSTNVTDSLGGLSISAPLPGSSCNRYFCSIFSGPFGPLTFSTPSDLPAGFFLTQSVSGGQVGLAFVAALASTHLAPASRVTLSADAPTIVRAYPTAGNGAPSPATAGFAWQLLGNGWSLVNGSGTANVTIEAFDTASPGTLTVWVNGSYDGTAESAPSVTLEIAAASTSVTQATVLPTSLDVGYPATFTVTGEGAGGYTYVADVSPGLGLATATAPCTTSVVADGLVALSCSVSVTYDQPGLASPTVNLTNGFSTASMSFAPVAVAPTLGLTVSPASAVAYVGETVGVDLTGDSETGTAPQGPACLWPGNGRTICDVGPGPTYPFAVAYGSAGVYSGHATLADRSGANVSVPFSATVDDRPMLSTIVASTNDLPVGQTATLVGSVSGGALPLEYWWNSSSPAGTLFDGTLSADGTLAFTFVPHISGSTTITLYVLDSLGTVVSYPTLMTVTAGPATNLLAGVGPGGATMAGSPTPVSWSAVNPSGEPVSGWSAPVSIVLAPAPGGASVLPMAWVNVSGAPISPVDGAYPVAASDWSSGELRCTVDIGGAGEFLVTLSGGLPPLDGGTGAVELTVAPNTSALVLSQPKVVLPGLRTNDTLWQIADRFGDALDGGSIRVDTIVSGVWHNQSSLVQGNATTGTSVWVNYSVPSDSAATVFVVSAAGFFLLPPIAIASPAAPSYLPVAWLLVAIGAALAAAAAFGLWGRRRRPDAVESPGGPDAPASEDELLRWAEGRAHVLLRASSERGQTLDELADGFVGRPPRPEEMTDWVASLVADGSLRIVLGDDGRSRFLRVGDAGAGPLTVQLDDRALAEALGRRDDLERDDPAEEADRA
jgi:hypothetical protein